MCVPQSDLNRVRMAIFDLVCMLPRAVLKSMKTRLGSNRARSSEKSGSELQSHTLSYAVDADFDTIGLACSCFAAESDD